MPTSNTSTLLSTFARAKLIGIVRTPDADTALWASIQLLEAGICIIEIPFTVPDTPRVIETLCERYPNAIIGAGTVLEAKDAMLALGAGAQFLVSPVLVEPLIQFSLEQDILALPGCFTPSEIYKAHSLGAPAVKLFPAHCAGGPEFIKAFKGPLPQIPIIPTGGIQLEHVVPYLQAGATAVGVGAPLIPKHLLAARDEQGLRDLAQSYLRQLPPVPSTASAVGT